MACASVPALPGAGWGLLLQRQAQEERVARGPELSWFPGVCVTVPVSIVALDVFK